MHWRGRLWNAHAERDFQGKSFSKASFGSSHRRHPLIHKGNLKAD
jgi:hypothetical protein